MHCTAQLELSKTPVLVLRMAYTKYGRQESRSATGVVAGEVDPMMREGAADRETLFKSSLVLLKRGLVTFRTARILGGSDSAGG